MLKFIRKFQKNTGPGPVASDGGVFHQQDEAFRKQLTANNQALEIIAEIQTVVYDDKPFTLGPAREKLDRQVDGYADPFFKGNATFDPQWAQSD